MTKHVQRLKKKERQFVELIEDRLSYIDELLDIMGKKSLTPDIRQEAAVAKALQELSADSVRKAITVDKAGMAKALRSLAPILDAVAEKVIDGYAQKKLGGKEVADLLDNCAHVRALTFGSPSQGKIHSMSQKAVAAGIKDLPEIYKRYQHLDSSSLYAALTRSAETGR